MPTKERSDGLLGKLSMFERVLEHLEKVIIRSGLSVLLIYELLRTVMELVRR